MPLTCEFCGRESTKEEPVTHYHIGGEGYVLSCVGDHQKEETGLVKSPVKGGEIYPRETNFIIQRIRLEIKGKS